MNDEIRAALTLIYQSRPWEPEREAQVIAAISAIESAFNETEETEETE